MCKCLFVCVCLCVRKGGVCVCVCVHKHIRFAIRTRHRRTGWTSRRGTCFEGEIRSRKTVSQLLVRIISLVTPAEEPVSLVQTADEHIWQDIDGRVGSNSVLGPVQFLCGRAFCVVPSAEVLPGSQFGGTLRTLF